MPRQTDSSEPLVPPALVNFDQLPDAAEVRLPVVMGLLGVSAPTVWRWAKDGRLPAPSRRGGVTAWQVGALRKLLAQAA